MELKEDDFYQRLENIKAKVIHDARNYPDALVMYWNGTGLLKITFKDALNLVDCYCSDLEISYEEQKLADLTSSVNGFIEEVLND